MPKIINKLPHHSGKQGWIVETEDGKKWSVLNFADVMKTANDDLKNSGVFMGWEAWNGNSEEMLRDTTEEGILEQVSKFYPPHPLSKELI